MKTVTSSGPGGANPIRRAHLSAGSTRRNGPGSGRPQAARARSARTPRPRRCGTRGCWRRDPPGTAWLVSRRSGSRRWLRGDPLVQARPHATAVHLAVATREPRLPVGWVGSERIVLRPVAWRVDSESSVNGGLSGVQTLASRVGHESMPVHETQPKPPGPSLPSVSVDLRLLEADRIRAVRCSHSALPSCQNRIARSGASAAGNAGGLAVTAVASVETSHAPSDDATQEGPRRPRDADAHPDALVGRAAAALFTAPTRSGRHAAAATNSASHTQGADAVSAAVVRVQVVVDRPEDVACCSGPRPCS